MGRKAQIRLAYIGEVTGRVDNLWFIKLPSITYRPFPFVTAGDYTWFHANWIWSHPLCLMNSLHHVVYECTDCLLLLVSNVNDDFTLHKYSTYYNFFIIVGPVLKVIKSVFQSNIFSLWRRLAHSTSQSRVLVGSCLNEVAEAVRNIAMFLPHWGKMCERDTARPTTRADAGQHLILCYTCRLLIINHIKLNILIRYWDIGMHCAGFV